MRAQNKNFWHLLKKGIFALFLLFALFLSAFSFILPLPIQAAGGAYGTAQDTLNTIGETAKLTDKAENTSSGYVIVGKVINMILSFVGILFLALIIWAGYQWMTAGGKEEKVSRAITIFKESIIGLSIVILAFLFVNFIMLRAVENIITAPTAEEKK